MEAQTLKYPAVKTLPAIRNLCMVRRSKARRYTPLFHDRWFWQLSNSASCWLIRPALGHRPVRERIAPMPVIGPRTLCAQSFSKALALPTSRGHLFGSAYHREFIAAPPYPNAHSVHTFMLAPEPKPPKAMALPQTIPKSLRSTGPEHPRFRASFAFYRAANLQHPPKRTGHEA